MKYLYAGQLFWFKRVWTSFGWNPQALFVYLLGNFNGGLEKVAKFVEWHEGVTDHNSGLSVAEVKYIEILKTLRHELQFVLRKVCEAGTQEPNMIKRKCEKNFSNELNKTLKAHFGEILAKYNIDESQFHLLVSESTQPMIRKLSGTLESDIRNLYKGVIPQINYKLLYSFSQERCLKFFAELYSVNLSLLVELVGPYLRTNRKISFESEEFRELVSRLEVQSQDNKFLLYQKFGFVEMEVPAGLGLSWVLEEYSGKDREFLSEFMEIQEDFKSMTEVLFSLVKL